MGSLTLTYKQATHLQGLYEQQKVDIITLDNCINTFKGNTG